ncbi:NAD(P)H-dependent oxidoreductase [Desulfitobacterium chlororespirans]|uniref:Flavodoxin-like fold n=1 Tax=Desulfitobacterium chlororespirans DSM 11544 TaxID=1121395 RepID=A0A1M7TVC9_9FIRM|nr:NAD(P)H-dependent oxidoreductase [Desulfitobacterium chlororespirans]SHN74648.1 Flavodoxin-like fold [Desulfitobacterium chlororespirans DSM 11544]
MKIALINGSPKAKNSASEAALQALRTFVRDSEITEYDFRKPQLSLEHMEQLEEQDVWVLAFPLYVDGIPSHLLSCLAQLENHFKARPTPKVTVYCLVNCGFYEGEQCGLALEMVENWCEKSGRQWGQGLGIGAGGMLPAIKNVLAGSGPKKNLGKALQTLAANIAHRTGGDNIFITANFPRFAYKFAAEAGWRKMVKANGLKTEDLFRQK